MPIWHSLLPVLSDGLPEVKSPMSSDYRKTPNQNTPLPMKTKIQFNVAPTTSLSASPWAAPAKTTYQDLILKPEFASRRLKFETGTTWFRIVPALPGSTVGWLQGIHALQYTKGRHIHPKTITPGAKSVFDHAYAWLKANQPESLYSKANKEGYRLLSDPLSLCWVLAEEEGKHVARLILVSGYDGSRGGNAGLGHQIWQLAQETDEDGKLLGDPAHPLTGVQLCVEKRQTPGARYASYTLKRGRVVAPIQDMLAKMDPEEVAALTPLEEVVHLPTEDEEWDLLLNVLDSETIEKIRESVE